MTNLLAPMPMSWPLDGLNEQTGQYDYCKGNESIRECIWNILLTHPGERLMRPEFGVGLRDFVHHPNNETTRHLIADMVKKGIERWETRVELQAIEVSADPTNLTQINITLNYQLRNNGQADSLSFNLNMDG